MRIAIVGCGKISRAHIQTVKSIAGAQICGVCDRDSWRARDVAVGLAGSHSYGDVASLLCEERPDTVHILTPPESHAALAVQAMQAGCHVLVEKPMALSVEEADLMIATARENQVKLCANHNYLFKPSILKARQLVQSGAVGEVVYVDSFYGVAGETGSYLGTAGRLHWAARLPGGAFTNFLPHLIYLQLAFLGDIEAVTGVTVNSRGADGPQTDMAVLLKGNGASGTMTISMRAKPYAKFVDIYGTKGIIHADLVREVCVMYLDRPLPRMLSKAVFSLEGSTQLAWGTISNMAMVALGKMQNMPELQVIVSKFYDCIKQDSQPPVPGEMGRTTVELMRVIWDRAQICSPRATTTTSKQVALRTEAESTVSKSGIPGKVLVTGATGFLGHRLVAALSRCGADVVALVRDSDMVSVDLRQQAKIVCGDVRDPASVDAAMKDVSVVYHCAAVTTNAVSWSAHYETTVRGTETVFKSALEVGAQRVIHASSVIVYGLDQRGGPVEESAPYSGNQSKWAYYLQAKVKAEELAFKYYQDARLPVTVMRLGILYGPGESRPAGRGLVQIGKLRLVIGSGRNRMPYTYVDNAVDCLLLAGISPEAIGQAINVVDVPQVTVRDVMTQRDRLTGDHTILVPVPASLLMVVARLLEVKGSLTQSDVPPKFTAFVVRSACRDMCYDTAKARKVLGWVPAVTLQQGLAYTV